MAKKQMSEHKYLSLSVTKLYVVCMLIGTVIGVGFGFVFMMGKEVSWLPMGGAMGAAGLYLGRMVAWTIVRFTKKQTPKKKAKDVLK